MSAYVVDPRTIDYLVAWASRRMQDRRDVYLGDAFITPEMRPHVGNRIVGEGRVAHDWPLWDEDATGRLLLAQNARSVQTRYPDTVAAPESMPGPTDQQRVFAYRSKPVPANLKAAWVVKSCDCLAYQSCETEDWEQTAAFRVLDTIREDAIRALVGEDAPWGVTDEDLADATVDETVRV